MSENAALPSLTRRKVAFRLVGLAVAISLLVAVLAQIDWSAFGRFASRLTLVTVFAAFSTYVAQNFFRALRYRALLARADISLRTLFPVSLYHNMLVRLLPFKLGEVSYIVLMRQRYEVSVQAGVSSLFSSRLLELLIIVLVTAVTLLLFGDVLPNQRALALILIVGCIGVGVVSLYMSGRILRMILGVTERLLPFDIVRKATHGFTKLATELDALREPTRFWGGLFWSLFTYGSTFATSAILLNGLGVRLSPDHFVVVISLGMFATAFPFNISGFGLVEWSLAFGLVNLAGMSLGEATALGLLLNGFQQLSSLVSGVGGFAALQGKSTVVERET